MPDKRNTEEIIGRNISRIDSILGEGHNSVFIKVYRLIHPQQLYTDVIWKVVPPPLQMIL